MRKIFRRLVYWSQSRRMQAELAEEMECHRAMNEAHGGGRVAMGNTAIAMEDARGIWIWPWLESVWRDTAGGFRAMRRQPGFTVVALLALGSAIGIDTSLFTAFNALALRPLAVRDPAHVVNLYRVSGKGTGGFSIAEYRYLAAHAHSFSGIVATRFGDQAATGDHKVNDCYVSGNYFQTLGVPMQLGRGFVEEEDRTGNPLPVVILSWDVWQNWFGGDPSLVGKQIRLAGVPFTVVGVVSRQFHGTLGGPTSAWIPLSARPLLRPNDTSMVAFLTSASFCCSDITGRLADGVSRPQAQAEVTVLLEQFRRQAGMAPENSRIAVTGTAWLDNPGRRRERAVPVLALMFLAVTLVVLLACANVGNLLLARAAARRHEMGVRLSLGGSRLRIIRQLLVESMTLAASAAAIGMAIAWLLPSFIVTRIAGATVFQLTPDFTVLAYAILISVLACAVFGLAPALHATRGNIVGALKQDAVLPGVRLSLRGLLLSVQVAISVLLLAGAGMLVRGVANARNADPGFTINDVTLITFEMPAVDYGRERTKTFARELTAGLETTPEMPRFALTMDAPLSNGTTSTAFHLQGEKQNRPVLIHEISSGYFDVLGIPILAGRNFMADDSDRPSIVVNQKMAKLCWPDGSAVGKTVVVNEAVREVVGVAKDAYTSTLGSIEPTVYFPMAGTWMPQVLVHGGGRIAVQKVTAVVKGLEPRARVVATPLAENLQAQTQSSMAGAAIAGGLGMLALALAAIGMSGVFAYSVRQRTREIGIRMALGAQPLSVVRLVLGSSVRALGAGLAVGLAAAGGIARILAHQFYGVAPFDGVTYAAVILLLATAALIAGAGPARRAARVDPVHTLREE